MKLTFLFSLLLAFAFLGLMLVIVPACSLRQPQPQAQPAVLGEAPQSSPDQWTVRRVGGDLEASVSFDNGQYTWEQCRITTPLPVGYPAPTPPDAIDLKRYPLVRRAGITGNMSPDWGMNFAFFPLFNHIKRREIAMTSPVEMDYHGLDYQDGDRPDSWTMSFLYRSAGLAPDGVDPQDDRVLIEDVAPVTVIALGMRGDYKMHRINDGLAQLHQWLDSQTEWSVAGPPRALFYNGPEARGDRKWLEVQIPVRPQ